MKIKKARKKRIINQRHMFIAELVERRPEVTQAEIVAYLDNEYGISVTQQTISNDLKSLKQIHWQRSKKAMQAIQDRLLNEYQIIYIEAMSAWYQSLEDKEVITTENISKPETMQDVSEAVERLKTIERVEGQSGNPALLGQARGALQDIEDLFGLEEPKKQEIDHISGGQSVDQMLEKILSKSYGNNSD